MLFKFMEILLSVSCKYVIISTDHDYGGPLGRLPLCPPFKPTLLQSSCIFFIVRIMQDHLVWRKHSY